MLYFILVVATLAGILGWSHPNPETKAMCRFVGMVTLAAAFILGAPVLVDTVAGWVTP
jgi:hypothetical protein